MSRCVGVDWETGEPCGEHATRQAFTGGGYRHYCRACHATGSRGSPSVEEIAAALVSTLARVVAASDVPA